jgi:hypothetical protein
VFDHEWSTPPEVMGLIERPKRVWLTLLLLVELLLLAAWP